MSLLEGSGGVCISTSNWERVGGGERSTFREDYLNVLALMRREYKDDSRRGQGYYASIFVEIKYFNDLSVDQVLAGCGLFDVDATLPGRLGGDVGDLFGYLAKRSLDVAKQGGWRPRDPDVIARLAAVALADSIGRCVCGACDGVKSVLSDGRLVPCRKCRGGGKKMADGKAYAKLLGVSPSKWSETWSWRYVGIANIFSEWECMVERLARRELYGD